jgi:hypothetical protein
VAVYADAIELEVYAVTKAITESYDLYRQAMPIMERWEPPRSSGYPSPLPFHDGAIRYFKERGVWSAEHQSWQVGILRRQRRLRQAWSDMMTKTPAAKDADAAGLAELWAPRRADVLKSI